MKKIKDVKNRTHWAPAQRTARKLSKALNSHKPPHLKKQDKSSKS